MPFFRININKNLLENGMNLDDDVLYNFTNGISQLMRDDGVAPWKAYEKTFLILPSFDLCFVKSKGIMLNSLHSKV